MSFGGRSECPIVVPMAGMVVADARVVEVTLSNGAKIREPTYRSPRGFVQSVRFWAVAVPCGKGVSALVARSASGKIVGRVAGMFLGHFG